MLKQLLIVYLAFFLVFSIGPRLDEASLVIITGDMSSPVKSAPFILKPVSYTSMYQPTIKERIKVIRVEGNDGCSQFQKVNPDELYLVFYLIDARTGSCGLTKRVNNVKKSSASGVIIVQSEQAKNNFSLMHNQDYFQVFVLAERQNSTAPSIFSYGSPFISEITASQPNILGISIAEIWISSLNQKSYELVDWWSKSLKDIPKVSSKASWSPRFSYISCKLAKSACGGDTTSCACGGAFCSPQKHGKTSNVLVREDIRQHLIFKESRDSFLKYMSQFKLKCLQNYIATGYVEDCSNSLLTHLEIDHHSLNQKIDRLLSSCDSVSNPKESELKLYQSMVSDQGRFLQIKVYPVITINHELMTVKSEQELKNELCRRLGLDNQIGCVIHETKIIEYQGSWSILFWILMTSLLVAASAYGIMKFRRKLRRDMNKELKMQVSTAVQHFFTLSEVKASN